MKEISSVKRNFKTSFTNVQILMRPLTVTILILMLTTGININRSWQPATTFSKADTSDVNPNGSSELSVLMRKMHEHALQARTDVLNNKLPKSYPKEFEKIYTATPTTPTTKNQYYDHYADLYMAALKNFVRSNRKNLKENYNNLVSSCVVCHTTHCPGPMVLIEKLTLE